METTNNMAIKSVKGLRIGDKFAIKDDNIPAEYIVVGFKSRKTVIGENPKPTEGVPSHVKVPIRTVVKEPDTTKTQKELLVSAGIYDDFVACYMLSKEPGTADEYLASGKPFDQAFVWPPQVARYWGHVCEQWKKIIAEREKYTILAGRQDELFQQEDW